MSKYTSELRHLCENYGRETVESWFKNYELNDYLTNEQIAIISEAGIWSKDKLAKKIVDHYYMREIGSETSALFKHFAKVKMQEIMERKLPLIYSSSINYDPLINVDYTESYTGTSTSNSTNSGSGISVNSDTPQGQIKKSEVLAGKFASGVGASETETNINDQSNQVYSKTVRGNSGVSATAQKMIQQYRENIIAIDEEIIYELNNLFMGLY